MDPILTPTSEGRRRPRSAPRLLLGALVLLTLVGAGLWLSRARNSATAPAAPASSAPAAAPAAPPRIRVAPERQQRIGVKFAEARLQKAEATVRAVGRVLYDETRITHVHTKVNGWIEDVFVNFVGAPVRRGQPLFTMYSPELVASQEEYLLALRARRDLGESAIARVSEGSERLLASARKRLELWDVSPSQIEALEKAGRVSRTITVHSPVDGVVTERAAYHHGRTVTPDLDLYTIVDLSHVWIQAEVYEEEVAHVKLGRPAEVRLPGAGEEGLHGRVAFVAPFVNPSTRTVQVRLEFPNQGLALRPEAFVNVVLKRPLGERLVVPKDAVMDTGEAQYVFVDQGDGYLEPRKVEAGPEVEGGRVIAKGLEAGERVATAANFILDSESRLKGAFDALGKPAVGNGARRAVAASISAEVVTDPSPPRVGRNRLRVKVADAAGQPITGAELQVRFFMPQMSGMAQVDVKTTLREVGAGEYAGEVELPIAWSFATTVTVTKGGQVVGTAQTTVTSR